MKNKAQGNAKELKRIKDKARNLQLKIKARDQFGV
tara:strand:- start:324 stop:428 length:105 start_codon:yes stop_codon:yes gene_type:complete